MESHNNKHTLVVKRVIPQFRILHFTNSPLSFPHEVGWCHSITVLKFNFNYLVVGAICIVSNHIVNNRSHTLFLQQLTL